MLWATPIAILFSLSGISYADNPGIKIRITGKGLEKGVQYIVKEMTSQNNEYQLPDVNGSTSIASEDMNYEFTQIRMVHFHCTTISTMWLPGTGLQISLQGGNATINCNWSLDSWLIKDSGSSVLTLSGMSVSMVLGFRQSDSNVPSIFLLDCQSSIQGIDVKMLGGVSYVYETIKQPIEDLVRMNVNQQLCSALRNQVKQWDQSLTHLKLNLLLNHLVDLDLSFVGNPEISDQYADVGLKGLFYLDNKMETAFSPAPMMLPAQHNSMFYVGISESAGNSLLAAYYTAGSLNFELFNMAGSKMITTSEMATYMPEISQSFPNPAPVKIQITATKSPTVYFKLNNMTMEFYGLIQTYAYPPNSTTQYLWNATIVAIFNAKLIMSDAIGVQGLNLTGSISLNRLQMDKSQSATKVAKGVVTEKRVQKLFSGMVVPFVNENLTQGMYIPNNFLKISSIDIKQGFALLAADLK